MIMPNGTCCTDTTQATNPYYGDHLSIQKGGTVYGTVFLTGLTDGSTMVSAGDIKVYRSRSEIDDLDDDSLQDYLVLNRTHIIIQYGNGYNFTQVFDAPIADAFAVQDMSIDIEDQNGEDVGDLVIEGTTSTRWIVDENMTFTIIPAKTGTGYFSVEYLKESKNHIDGNLEKGDIARLYWESPRPISEDEEVLIRLIPKVGSATNIKIITPDVMTEDKIYLFP